MQKEKTSGKKKVTRKRNPGNKPVPKKNTGSYSATITIGDISRNSGQLNLAGRDIKVSKTSVGIGAEEARKLFDALYQAIDSRTFASQEQKDSVQEQVKEIQSMVAADAPKSKKATEAFLFERFRNIARMAPDVLDVVVKTLANPILGLGEVASKIAKKAKEQT